MLMLLLVPWGLKMLDVFHQTSGGFLNWGSEKIVTMD